MPKVKETTEFGLDMVRGLPKAYYYAKHNIGHQCVVKRPLEQMYKLVSNNVEVTDTYGVLNPAEIYGHKGPSWIRKNWTPPPLKEMFEGSVTFDKPTIVINNKFAADFTEKMVKNYQEKNDTDLEYGAITRPNRRYKDNRGDSVSINSYSLTFISELVERYSDKFKIIYISPIYNDSYFKDHNVQLRVNDFEYLEKNHPEVYTIKQFLEETDLTRDYNIAQFMLEATSDKHLSLVGGNCKLSSYFGGDVIIYMSEFWRHGHPNGKGNRGIFKTDSWLKHLSGANIIQMNTYNDILNYIDERWVE